jgi:hypothetical protein
MLQQAIIFADLGRIAEAQALLTKVEEAARAQRVLSTASITARAAVALGASIHGQPNPARIDDAIAAVTNAVVEPGASTWDRLMQQMIVTPFLGRSGRITEAFELLNTGARLGAVAPFDWLLLDPRLEPLRKDPRFFAYAAGPRSRFTFAERSAKVPGVIDSRLGPDRPRRASTESLATMPGAGRSATRIVRRPRVEIPTHASASAIENSAAHLTSSYVSLGAR